MSKFVGILVGGLEIAAGVVLALAPGAQPLAGYLIAAGVGTVLSGVGTLLSSSQSGTKALAGGGGLSTVSRNPIAPWVIQYGPGALGGTIVHISEFGADNKWMDMVIVLAAHPCEAVDALLFDKKRLLLNENGDSFTPIQEHTFIESIERVKGVVTVHLVASSTNLSPGDQIQVVDVAGDQSLNGVWPVSSVFDSHTRFTYVCGGSDILLTNDGATWTRWPDYSNKVHMEVLLGDHAETFYGMVAGTPNDGNTADLVVHPNNPWTAEHRLLGKTAVFLRFHYDQNVFSGGIPQISFLVRGRNEIFDPRLGTTGYTDNAALCIADFLNNSKWGFGAIYGSEIPTAELIAAANICDEAVGLANGETEPRYALAGKFDLSARRGEILQNMLTACAGRLTYQGGQFKIWPAAWRGSSPGTGPSMNTLTGAFTWRAKSTVRDLVNGVKGVYISPANNWQASDIPAYAQDELHHYELDENLLEDGGDRRWLDIQLPFTISSATAQRICKIELLRRRHQGTGTFRMNLSGYSIATMDVVPLNIAYFGWAGKLVEVLSHRFTLTEQQDGDSRTMLLGTEIDVQETDASIYDWLTSEELTPQGYQQPFVPDASTPAAPGGLELRSDADTAVVGTNGKLVPAIQVSWIEPTDGYVLQGGHIEIQFQKILDYREGNATAVNGWEVITGAGTNFQPQMATGVINIAGVQGDIKAVPDPTHLTLDLPFEGETVANSFYSISYGDRWIGVPSVNPTVTEVSINKVIAGQKYNVAVRAVNAGGVPSPWVTDSIVASGTERPLPWRPWGELVFTAPFGRSIELAQRGAFIDIKGYPPINRLSTTLAAPVIDDYGFVEPHTYSEPFVGDRFPIGDWIGQMFGIDADGLYSPGSNYMQFSANVPSSRLTFTASFPTGTVKAQMFFGRDKEHLLHQAILSAPVSGAQTVQSISYRSGWGPPDPRSKRFHIEASREYHGGIFAAVVAEATETTIRLLMPGGTAFGTNDLVGRWISLISKSGMPDTQSGADLKITANTTDGVLTVANGNTEFEVDDLIMVRTQATAVSETTIQDDRWKQPYAPNGMADDQDKDKHLMILYDPTGSALPGDTVTVLSNTGTTHTVTPWRRVPGIGSVFVSVEPSNIIDVVTKDFDNALVPGSYEMPVVASIPATALSEHVALVRVRTQDAEGNDSIADHDALREMYIVPQIALGLGGYRIIPLRTVTRTVAVFMDAVQDNCWISAEVLDSTGLPVPAPFLLTLDSECVLVKNLDVPTNPQIVRGWNGTIAAAHNVGAPAVTVTATPDLAEGANQAVILDGRHISVLAPVNPFEQGMFYTQYLVQPGDKPGPAFVGGLGGFVSSTTDEVSVSPDANTRTSIVFTNHGTRWAADSFKTGVAIE